MKKAGPVQIYSSSWLLTEQSGLCELYVLGNPTFINKQADTHEWIKKIASLYGSGQNSNYTRLAEELNNTRGIFSLILKKRNEYIIVSDIIRSHPIFYGFHKNKFFITDKLEDFQRDNGRFEIDYEKLDEYISCGLVLGKGTLYKNVYGLQAGEMVTVSDRRTKSHRYFKLKPSDKPVKFKNISEFTNAFDKVLISVFSNMLRNNTNPKRWIVPLSGGHDSRLIVNYLYRLGVKNVLCFTYGLKNNEQARISKMLADILGYEWHFVEYTEQKWQEMHKRGLITGFIYHSFNGVSIPHLQDFLAIYELKDKNIITDDDIIIPGHSAVTSRFNQGNFDFSDNNDVVRLAYCHETVASNIDILNEKALQNLSLIFENSGVNPENFRAFINWQERQSKFTVNSIQAYDFFGFKSQLPFWDRLMVDFWLDYPANQRVGRQVLYQAEENGLLVDELKQVPFAGQTKESGNSSLKSRIKKILPDSLLVKLLRLTGRKAKLDEAMNQIYSLEAGSVSDLISPLSDFPGSSLQYFNGFLSRLTYQVDSNLITRLYVVRKLLDKIKG